MNLLSRIEKLERDAPGIGRPDHIVTYIVDSGDDETAAQESAVMQYRAEHDTRPADVFGFICFRVVDPIGADHVA
jgi:hypothetical protein